MQRTHADPFAGIRSSPPSWSRPSSSRVSPNADRDRSRRLAVRSYFASREASRRQVIARFLWLHTYGGGENALVRQALRREYSDEERSGGVRARACCFPSVPTLLLVLVRMGTQDLVSTKWLARLCGSNCQRLSFTNIN